jgi:hypothetical protein
MRNIIINAKQKTVLKVISAAIFLVLLFPPFRWVDRGSTQSAGFSIVFHPPKMNYSNFYASIDIWMLQIEFFAILVIGFIFFLINAEQE